MGVLDGEVCRKYGCHKCCLETEMPLTEEDIRRIEALGYRRGQFAVQRDGVWRLRNLNGKCFFLGDDGLCQIYEHRPMGCRLYPVIEVDGECSVDTEFCPYAHLVSKEELMWACPLVKKLNRMLFKEWAENYKAESGT